MKTVTLGEMLTDAQLVQCRALFPDHDRIREEVVVPNLAAIDEQLGQENDPNHLAYLIVYAIARVDADARARRDP